MPRKTVFPDDHWSLQVDIPYSMGLACGDLIFLCGQADLEADAVLVDEAEIRAWAEKWPQPYDREAYLGLYADVHGAPEEPFNRYIQELARNGLKNVGHDGPVSAMGVPRQQLPSPPLKALDVGGSLP